MIKKITAKVTMSSLEFAFSSDFYLEYRGAGLQAVNLQKTTMKPEDELWYVFSIFP